MAQISLYIDDAEMASLRKDADKDNRSLSAYVRGVLSSRHDGPCRSLKGGWPEGYFGLYGSSPDFPEVPDPSPKSVEAW